LVNKEKTKPKIYTRKGDFGETSLCNGSRTSKDSLRVEAYGSVDETSTYIGLYVVKTEQVDLKHHLMEIQKDLFAIGSNLALPNALTQEHFGREKVVKNIPKIKDQAITKLENWIDKYDKELPDLDRFILCGGTESSAILHIARTVCRKAERRIVSLKKHEEIDKNVLKYMNRLSDYLFTAARLESHRVGKDDLKWHPFDVSKSF